MLDLGTPDDFRAQPYAWLTNQMAHSLVGLIGAWLMLQLGAPGWCAVAAAALTSAAIETLHLRRGGSFADSLTDFLYVVAGAVWQVIGGALWLLAIIVLDLAVGVRLRSVDQANGGH